MKYPVVAVIGGALGFIGSRILFVGSALSLLPWTVVGLAIGFAGFASTEMKKNAEAAGLGAVYGFSLAFVFMIAGYNGTASLISRLPFFAVLGIVGAICGAVLGLIGAGLRQLVKRG